MEWLLEVAAEQPGSMSNFTAWVNEWPEPWVGSTGQRKCGACGRFVSKNGTCSLFLPVYRYGSYAGMEHR